MVRFDVTPQLVLSGDKEVNAAALVRFNHGDNRITVRVPVQDIAQSKNLDGLSVGVLNDRFDLIVNVADQAPRFRINSHVDINDKRVGLRYQRDVKGNTSSVRAIVDVDDSNSAGVIYDLTNFESVTHKACTLQWTHRQGDVEITPMYNLGTESLAVDARYIIDDENSLRANYDMNSNMGMLRWTNTSGTGGGGDLRITARANLTDAQSAKQMPTMLIEKTWAVEK